MTAYYNLKKKKKIEVKKKKEVRRAYRVVFHQKSTALDSCQQHFVGIPGNRISPAKIINGEREMKIASIIMGTWKSKKTKDQTQSKQTKQIPPPPHPAPTHQRVQESLQLFLKQQHLWKPTGHINFTSIPNKWAHGLNWLTCGYHEEVCDASLIPKLSHPKKPVGIYRAKKILFAYIHFDNTSSNNF